MKNLFNLFFLIGLFSSCVHDPCKKQPCNNGGTCSKGLCECTEGWGGLDCSEEQTPSKMYITKIVLLHYTGSKPGGLSWDSLDAADIYLYFIKNGFGGPIYTSQTIQNANSNISYEFIPSNPVKIDKPLDNYIINLWDNDGGWPKDELIASGSFVPYIKGEKFPKKVFKELSWGQMTAKVEIYYDYEW